MALDFSTLTFYITWTDDNHPGPWDEPPPTPVVPPQGWALTMERLRREMRSLTPSNTNDRSYPG